MADNDPKHMSNEAKGVNYWRTTAESPDCNPIENLWHELKEYNRRVVKPTNKQQLIDGIQQFIFIIIIIIITSSGDLQPSTAIVNQLPSQIVSTQIRTTGI